MVKASSRLPRLPSWLALAAGLLLLFTAPGSTSSVYLQMGDESEHAADSETSFTLTQEQGAPVVHRDGVSHVVEADLGRNPIYRAIADGRVAALSATRLTLIRSDSSIESTEISDCIDVASSGNRLVLICKTGDMGDPDYGLKVLDSNLRVVGMSPIQKPYERSSTIYAPEVDDPYLVTAGPEGLWLEYRAQDGAPRDGPRWLVKFALTDGSVLGTVKLRGIPVRHQTSPDGRYLALLVGGSSGACYSYSSLMVVDLKDMRILDADPPVPPLALALADNPTDIVFQGTGLQWQDNRTLITLGLTYSMAEGNCDGDIRAWSREFRVGSDGSTDTGMANVSETFEEGWVGPGCSDVVVVGTEGLIYYSGGRSTLVPKASLLVGAAKPKECR
jgi:hypothetical protein